MSKYTASELTMYWCAVRYALGRESYISGLVVEWTEKYEPYLGWRKEDIMKEIKDYYGDDLDDNWQKVYDLLS